MPAGSFSSTGVSRVRGRTLLAPAPCEEHRLALHLELLVAGLSDGERAVLWSVELNEAEVAVVAGKTVLH